VSSEIMELFPVEEESPLMCRDTRLGRVERQDREALVSEMDETRVREVR